MPVELIPAILATTFPELRTRAAVAQRLAPTVHLDLMDGVFVATKSVKITTLQRLAWRRKLELHVMVKHPKQWLSAMISLKPKRVYLPCETGSELNLTISALQARHIEVGLAINPTTPISRLSPYVGKISSILVMAVRPGRYQAPYWTGTIKRLKAIHRRWPRIIIVCDGGMNNHTIGPVVTAGTRRVVIGSAAILNLHPDQAWQTFQALTRVA